MYIIKSFLIFLLLSISLTVTYSIAIPVGIFLAMGSAINHPILWTIGKLRGRR
jgi:hypothetical protein